MPRPQNEKENLQFVQELAEVDGPFESPININFLDLTKLELPPLCWNRNDVLPKKLKLTNTGHTVILSGRWNRERPYLTGGPLEGNYVFSQIHFHWGPDNCRGSEHTVCGEKFPLEMHVAHFKTEYSTQECALQERDGMVVLVYLFKLQDEPNASLRKIIKALSCIQESSTSVNIDPRPILALLNPFTDDYFMYWGSVVTSTCAHILMWIISREPFGISREQMEEFRKIMDCTQRPIQRNNRDPQPLHGRNVFHVNPSRCLDKPLLPIKKIVGCFCSDVSDHKETGDDRKRSVSRGCCCNNINNKNNNNNNNNRANNNNSNKNSNNSKPQQSQEEIEDKESKTCRSSVKPEGKYNKQLIYVQHATIHSNPVFKKRYYTGDSNVVQGQKKELDLNEKDEVSQKSCCFLPVKKELKDGEKGSRKDKTSKNRERKKSFDSVKALSNIIDSLEALKNHTYKKLQELDSINTEIKELKKHCEEPEEQRWLRKIEKIITRQKRYTLRTSRCCFSELKKLAKEYNIDKVIEKKITLSSKEEKDFPTEEDDLYQLHSDQVETLDSNPSPLTCYNAYKQEKFSKKAQKLIKSFFEDIQENEEAQKTVQKDLELRKMSKRKLEDEIKTHDISADGSKVLITQQMFTLGNFGNRFFTEVAAEEKAKEVEAKRSNEKESNESPCKKGKDKIIPLHRTDVVKFRNKDKLKKSSSSSSAFMIDSNESEIKLKKKKSKITGKYKENTSAKTQKKSEKMKNAGLSSEETSQDEMKMLVISKRKSRKDLWENQSAVSEQPAVNSPKKKNTCQKSTKRKLHHVKKEIPKRKVEKVVELTEKSSQKISLEQVAGLGKLKISPERKKLKLDQTEISEDSLTVFKGENLNQMENVKEDMLDENVSYSPKENGDFLRENGILIPIEYNQECKKEKLEEIIKVNDLTERSWTAPSSKERDNSVDKKLLMASPSRFERCIQRRVTSPVIVYHNANKKSPEVLKSYRYEIHNHENPAKTFIENWCVETEPPIVEKYHFLEKELKDEEPYRETDFNDSNYEKLAKTVKSDLTILSLRSSENEEMRKDGKSRTISAESFNSTKTIHKKKRRQRQSRTKQKNPSTVKMLDTIESSRLEFSNLTEDEQLQIISANVASFVKQKLLEHKRYLESKEKSDELEFGEVEHIVLKELKSIGGSKHEEEDTDTLENQWSTAALNVPSVKEIKKPEPKESVESEIKKKPTTKPVHNFIKKNKLLAGKYKRRIPVKQPNGPKTIIKSSQTRSTEPTSSDYKSPVRVVKPHACNPILRSPQEKARDRSAGVQKQRTNSAKSPATQKQFDNKRPASSKDTPKLQPTVPPAVQKIPKPKKRWIPTYTLTSYLHTPLEIAKNQRRKFLFEKEDKVEKFDLNTNDLEYLIKLEMCINNEIAANMENSMNYVKTLLSQDCNGTAIIEKPPIKDSFNIFDPINNNGILLIELRDSRNTTESVTDYETSETGYSLKKLKNSRRKKRRIKKKWSELNKLNESGDQTVWDSDYISDSSDLETKQSEKSGTDNNKDVSQILKKYIYHLGRGEESNINLTVNCSPPTVEETVPNSKPQIKKRKEKLLLSNEMKEKLLEVLTEEMKQEKENKRRSETASSPDSNSISTQETVICECERTEMWAKMLKDFLEDKNNHKGENSEDPETDELNMKNSEEDTSKSFNG